ncbi:MAG: TatD family hydrolase [Mucinivorans sp.]
MITFVLMIDTHSHIFDEAFDADRAQVIARAVEAGVELMVMPAIDSQSYARMFEVARCYPNCRPTIGLHPTSINENPRYKEELSLVRTIARNSPCPLVAIGEVGLDLHWSSDFLAQQQYALCYQIELALELKLPLILHTRQAWEPTFEILDNYDTACGVFHSFSGEAESWRRIEPMNFYVGIGGSVTYKKSLLPKILPQIPLERILLETDAPYLTPQPYRSERNESCHLNIVAARIAQIKGVTLEQVQHVTTQNARRLFNLR